VVHIGTSFVEKIDDIVATQRWVESDWRALLLASRLGRPLLIGVKTSEDEAKIISKLPSREAPESRRRQ
jgi:hypothetical protein